MRRTSFAPGHSGVLLGALALEAVLFSFVAPNFFTVGNFFEITRLSVELGLLAVAMTPVLIAGGIDLSVGAMMGLSAVCLGALWHDLHLPLMWAIAGCLMVGAAGGDATLGGVAGSAYFVGGFGMTALGSGNIVLVPIRSGVGLRLGANIGYLHFTRSATWNPF